MKLLYSILLLFCSGTIAATQTILYDPHFSPFSGSANLLFVENMVLEGEDYFLKGSGRNSTSKVWGRGAEQLLFWNTLNMLAAVTQHEVFGHGYRLRELGNSPDKYTITPWGGATYFNVNDSFQIGKLLAVDVAGLEAEAILARDLKMHWMREGAIEGRLGTLYTQTQQSLFWYTLITHLGRLKQEEVSEGNDIDSYIHFYNASYRDNQLSEGKLTRWAIFNWLDPMTVYAYYAFFYYISEGKPWKFPVISLGDNIKYLPNVRIGYAPYGPEAYLENFFSIAGEPLYFYFKGGRKSVGIGATYSHLYAGDRGTVGFRFDGWNQREFISSATYGDYLNDESLYRTSLDKGNWGAALSVTTTLNLFSQIALYSELGGKTSGYLPGYSLSKDVFFRVGLTIGKNSLRNEKNFE